MNVVYISQLYLNLTPGSHAHQLFVSGKARDQSKRPALNQQQLSLRTERLEQGHSRYLLHSRSHSESLLHPTPQGGQPSLQVAILVTSQQVLKLIIPPFNGFLLWSSGSLHLAALGWFELSIFRVVFVFVVVLFCFNPYCCLMLS